MSDIRFINKNGTSVDAATVRKHIHKAATDAKLNPLYAASVWYDAMAGDTVLHEVIEKLCDIDDYRFRIPIMRLPIIVGAMTVSASAFAAGVDSRAYTCDGLHALVAANRFVFINYPSFMDFVVANDSYCSSGEVIQLRTVPASDNPECLVNRCRNHSYSN